MEARVQKTQCHLPLKTQRQSLTSPTSCYHPCIMAVLILSVLHNHWCYSTLMFLQMSMFNSIFNKSLSSIQSSSLYCRVYLYNQVFIDFTFYSAHQEIIHSGIWGFMTLIPPESKHVSNLRIRNRTENKN